VVTPDRLRAFFNRKFVRDTLILQVGKVGMTASTFLSALLVARLMGAADYGIWALAQSVLSIAQTFNLTGLNTSLSTQLPMAVGAKDDHMARWRAFSPANGSTADDMRSPPGRPHADYGYSRNRTLGTGSAHRARRRRGKRRPP